MKSITSFVGSSSINLLTLSNRFALKFVAFLVPAVLFWSLEMIFFDFDEVMAVKSLFESEGCISSLTSKDGSMLSFRNQDGLLDSSLYKVSRHFP